MEYPKTEAFWESSASVLCNRQAMRTLYILACKYGMDAVYSRIEDGDYYSIAEWVFDLKGYSGPTVSELEDEFMQGEAFAVYAERLDRKYRLGPDGDGVVYHIVGDFEKGLKLETRDDIERHVKEMEGYIPGKPLMQNFYNVLAVECREDDGIYTVSDEDFAPKVDEQLVKPKPEPAMEQAGRTIIREKVVIKEEPPELENMLRQAMVEQLVKMNLDEVHQTVKKRLVEDFGFEPQRHVVVVAEQENEIDDIVHEKFDEVLHYVANNVPVFEYGPAGGGKGVLGRQVAQALGLDYHFMTSVTDEFKINGYMDAYGIYHETPFYKAFTRGGVFFLDEMDASAPEVLVCLNMAISDRRYTFPHETVEAHPDFRVLAAGNTLGTGADAAYVGRMQLDAASLNRFVVVEVDYDRNIDTYCAGGDEELVRFAWAFRETVREIGLPSLCSYRNIEQIRIASSAIPLERVLQSCLCKEMNQDDINIVVEKMRGKVGGNEYFGALANVKSMVG